MCSVRQRPIPFAPKRNASSAFFGVSPLAYTSNPLTVWPEAVLRVDLARISSAQPRNVSRSPEIVAGFTATCPSYTLPVAPSIVRKSPFLYDLPFTTIVLASLNVTSEQPQTQGVPIPRATTAACDVRPPVDVRIPCATAIPAMSSGEVSLRTRRTFLPSFAQASASSAVNTI